MNLVLIAENYPLSEGDYFIDNEMLAIHTFFHKIFIVTSGTNSVQNKRFIPENADVQPYDRSIGWKRKIWSIPLCFRQFFMVELKRQISEHGVSSIITIFKIMFMEMIKSDLLRNKLDQLIELKKLKISETIFYSYWHDSSALTLAIMRNENSSLKCIGRAHGWDVFKTRQAFPYLPFKNFILRNLSGTFVVSNAGKNELLSYSDDLIADNIIVSRLGVSNDRIKRLHKENDQFIICSCSTIISIKRIHLIADILSNSKTNNLTWVHFGDGPLKKEVELYAEKIIPNVRIEFKGMVPNNQILDYYEKYFIDLFINVSESEGIPVSIMEALSSGIPVIATDVGGNREIVNEDHGFLINRNPNPIEVARLIDEYFNLPDDTFLMYRKNAIDFWENNYSAGKNYTEFANFIRKT